MEWQANIRAQNGGKAQAKPKIQLGRTVFFKAEIR